jgi:hypothetical protein
MWDRVEASGASRDVDFRKSAPTFNPMPRGRIRGPQWESLTGTGKFFRAARSPYPQQRHAVRMIIGVAAAFLAIIAVVALLAGR